MHRKWVWSKSTHSKHHCCIEHLEVFDTRSPYLPCAWDTLWKIPQRRRTWSSTYPLQHSCEFPEIRWLVAHDFIEVPSTEGDTCSIQVGLPENIGGCAFFPVIGAKRYLALGEYRIRIGIWLSSKGSYQQSVAFGLKFTSIPGSRT